MCNWGVRLCAPQRRYQLITPVLSCLPFRLSINAGFLDIADFGLARSGSRALYVDGHKYVKDRETTETINWRCSHFIRDKCRARAITRRVAGVERVRVTKAQHTHAVQYTDVRVELSETTICDI